MEPNNSTEDFGSISKGHTDSDEETNEEQEEEDLSETEVHIGEITTPHKPLGKKAKRRALRNMRSSESYNVPLRKILKEIHPDIGMTGKAMDIMDSIVNCIFEQLANEASRMAKCMKQKTINRQHIEGSVRVLFPDGLAKRAIEEGTLAVTSYCSKK